MNMLSILLMQPAEGQEGGLISFLPMVLLLVVIFLFFIRPQMKRSKEQKKFRDSIEKNQKIITIGGIHGKVNQVSDDWVIIEVEGKTLLKVDKSAIAMDAQDAQQLQQKR